MCKPQKRKGLKNYNMFFLQVTSEKKYSEWTRECFFRRRKKVYFYESENLNVLITNNNNNRKITALVT